MSAMDRARGGSSLVLAAAFGLSLKGIWARLAYADGLDVLGVMFYRAALALPLLLGAGWWAVARAAPGGATAPAPTLREHIPAALLGALFPLGMYCDFRAIDELGAGLSRVLLFGFPLAVMVLESAAARRFPSRIRLLGFCVAWLGLVVVAWPQLSWGASQEITALGWGLASLFLYALYVWRSAPEARRLGSLRLTVTSNLATTLTVVVAALMVNSGRAPDVTLGAAAWIGAMVLVSTIVPYLLLNEGVRRLGAIRASLLSMVGPPFTLLAAWAFLGEGLSWGQGFGVVLTLSGVSLAQGVWSPARLVEG